jgi:hypothetical protein
MSAHLALAELLLALAGMGACVWLFVLTKAEMRGGNNRSRRRAETIEASVNAVRVSLANLSKRLEETERQTGLLAPPPPTRSGFNLSKRSQAIRMSRRGETPSQIAAVLELPQGEVDLLLKVHRLVVSLPVTSAASKGP